MSAKELDIYTETQRLAVLATTAIQRAMKLRGVKRSQLAAKLGVPNSRVTKVLDGETNITLKTLAAFGLACDVRWQFAGVDANDGSMIIEGPNACLTMDFSNQPGGYFLADWGNTETDKACIGAATYSKEPIGPLLDSLLVTQGTNYGLTG